MAEKDYSDIYKGLARILNKHNVAYDIIPNTKDVWCRDYMPLQLDKERYLCYEYKPDYLMKNANNRKYITDSLNVCRDMQLNIKETPLIIDGGNVVKVGNKAIMTEKVFVENPSIDEDTLKKQMENRWNVRLSSSLGTGMKSMAILMESSNLSQTIPY